MSQTHLKRQKSEDTLLSQAFDITMMGVILTIVMALVDKKITGQGVVVICCFLAATYLWKLVWPLERFRRYFAWQIFCVVMVCFFSWWLIFTAENTRAGWYRFNVLKTRIESFAKHAPAYVIIADQDGDITATSDNIHLLTGYTSNELVGRHVTILMRDGPAVRHQIAYTKAVDALRDSEDIHQGWMLQGLITVAIKHKNGNLVPVKAYAGGIRWSTDIQFKGDIDMFSVFVPVNSEDATKGITTIGKKDSEELQTAPAPPPVTTPPLKVPPIKPVSPYKE